MSIGASGRTVADLKNGIDAHIRQQMRNARPTTLWKQAKIRAIEDDTDRR